MPPPSAPVVPASVRVSPQSTPSGMLQLVAPVSGGPQVPSVAPVATLQIPVQQSVAFPHTSPLWPQNDDALQRPLKHSPEQHSAPAAQVLLRVLQLLLSGTHAPAVQ